MYIIKLVIMGAYFQYYPYTQGKTIKKSALCCLLASLIIALLLWRYVTNPSLFISFPIEILYPAWIIVLISYGLIFFILGIILYRSSNKYMALSTIIISSILLAFTLLTIRLNPWSIQLIMPFTIPSIILGLMGGFLEICNLHSFFGSRFKYKMVHICKTEMN